MVHVLDLKFLDTPNSIAAFAIPDKEGGKGLTLVESGPYSTNQTLVRALEQLGYMPADVHTVLLTHIHFDHAGAAWWWAVQGAHIYVHPRGYRHMVDPSRLYNSARQIYGNRMDELWGEMQSIDEGQITAVEDRASVEVGGHHWVAHHTPGHASHHIAWQLEREVFTGDVGGCGIHGGPAVPPLPPPDIDVPAWQRSIERLRGLDATAFYLTHYGRVTTTRAHLTDLERRLGAYFDWLEPYYRDGTPAATLEPLFKRFVREELTAAGVGEADLAAYMAANPPYMSVVGMLRYLTLRDQRVADR